MSNDEPFINTLRHDTAHVLAMAVQELFPDTQVTIGPVIENGFYYDFDRKEPFTEKDLGTIEKKMKEIVNRDEKTSFKVMSRENAPSQRSTLFFLDDRDVVSLGVVARTPSSRERRRQQHKAATV